MAIRTLLLCSAISIITLTTTSCSRQGGEVWDDTVSCGRYMNRGFQTLCGSCEDSRQVNSPDDFWNYDGSCAYNPDFMPFLDDMDNDGYTMSDSPPSRHSPGDPGSRIPGIEAFSNPSSNPALASIYRPLHFAYNSQAIQSKEDIQTLSRIASYMKEHPETYLFVEGHCDIRGPEAYNLALGSRRSNEVRNTLIKEGVNPDNIFTVSYGKERLVAFGNDEDSHRQNRRAEFKIYQR